MPQQHITNRTTAHGGDAGHHHYTEQIHAQAPRGQGTGHGFGGDADQIEG